MHEAEENFEKTKVDIATKKKINWNDASKVNNVLASERSRDRLVRAQMERSEDQARVLRDIEKAQYEMEKSNYEALEKREFQRKIFTDALVQKAEHMSNVHGGLQPLEYKLNKATLDSLGLSPESKKLKIIPK